MTYGLIPRVSDSKAGVTFRWDDLERPWENVLVSQAVSEYRSLTHSPASVNMLETHVQDYATLRKRTVLRIFYAAGRAPLTKEIETLLGEENVRVFELPGHHVDIRRDSFVKGTYIAQVWGVDILMRPGPSPVTAASEEFPILQWPGHSSPVQPKSDFIHIPDVYVKDAVLSLYEGRPRFEIHPPSGSVSYGSQWGVSGERVGRDLIRIDLKKLYEGNHPSVIRHFHSYAVDVSHAQLSAIASEKDIARLTENVLYDLIRSAQVWELLMRDAGKPESVVGLVGYDPGALSYNGWWMTPELERCARHAPLSMTRETFLSRCMTLQQAFIEPLSLRHLRQLLVSWGAPEKSLANLGSLKLLHMTLQLAKIAKATGLRLPRDFPQVDEQRDPTESLTPALFALNDLRIVSGHSGRTNKISSALEALGIDERDVGGEWGRALDRVYEAVALDFQRMGDIFAELLEP